jgi:hypothetical protein
MILTIAILSLILAVVYAMAILRSTGGAVAPADPDVIAALMKLGFRKADAAQMASTVVGLPFDEALRRVLARR